VLLGTGVVEIGVGVVFGVITLSIKSDADNACNKDASGNCASQAARDAADTKRHEGVVPSWISTAGIGIGAVSVLLGVYFAFIEDGSPSAVRTDAAKLRERDERARGTAKIGGVHVWPVVGPTSAGVSGAF
jgi:hypothetical protein